MLRFERGDPRRETVVGWGHWCGRGRGPAPLRSYMQEVAIIFSDFIPR